MDYYEKSYNSDDKIGIVVIPEVPEEFSIQQCNLHLNYSNTRIQVRNYLQDNSHSHLMFMNSKRETFIPYVQPMSCACPSIENGKLVPFFHATQTPNMFLLPKNFRGNHVVIDSRLEDIEKYKDKDDLLLRRENENPFIIKMEDFYNDRNKWRDVNFLLWSDGKFSPYLGLQQKVNKVMGYQDKLKNDYGKIVKEYSIDFTKSISITHNQDDTSTSVEQDEERIGVVILKNTTPDRIKVSSSGTDLVFSDKVSNHVINTKNWNNSESYRISMLEFDLGLEPVRILGLDRVSLSEVGKIQDLINQASGIYHKKAELELNKQLFAVIHSCDLNKVKDLISKGASVDIKDSDGWTLLHHTARRGYLEVAEFLIEKGADINAEDKYGKKPIQRAAEDNNKNIITLLLSKGVNINDTDRNGRTSLYWAAWNGNLDAVKYLVGKDASIQAGDKDGKTALDIARDKGYNDVVNYLEEELNKEREKPVQRRRRRHHGDHVRHHMSRKPLAIDSSNQPEIAVSGSTKTIFADK